MTKNFFTEGVFSELFVKFIAYKQSLGFKYNYYYSLNDLNEKLNKLNLTAPTLTKEIVVALCELRDGEARTSQAKRICFLRHFAEFLNNIGIEAYVYPTHYKPIYYDNFKPYIFSSDEIRRIFKSLDELSKNNRTPFYHLIWPAFVRVLYGCGLRLSECLNLKQEHVNLIDGILYVEKSKKGTSRYVPLSASLQKYLIKYVEAVHELYSASDYFFPSSYTLGKLSPSGATNIIKQVYKSAGIKLLPNGRLPRIHDLRHTFCCHTFEAMKKKGYDLYYSVPILSVYIGHQEIRDTERYLHLPEFHHDQLVLASDAVLGDIEFMEVNDDEIT
ncbi:MAG: tyrosine-type recombinase/integrase [Enterococcus sp.]|jgi:integrase/recombinase XerD|nr:tyrosine-type recombinase/integrase [Enterococcus sp.]